MEARAASSDRGSVIVEATIVFPIMFIVIFMMLFITNGYLQKCRVESIVQRQAIAGAAYCGNPLLDEVKSNSLPDYRNLDAKPYRYIIGGMNEIEADIQSKVSDEVSRINTGFFSGMMPSLTSSNVKFNNYFIYSTFEVDADYKVKLPIRLIGQRDFYYMNFSAHANVPVSDTPEFIRNVDMVEDYMERYGVLNKISEMIEKAKEWFRG